MLNNSRRPTFIPAKLLPKKDVLDRAAARTGALISLGTHSLLVYSSITQDDITRHQWAWRTVVCVGVRLASGHVWKCSASGVIW